MLSLFLFFGFDYICLPASLRGGVHDFAAVEDEILGEAERRPAGDETPAEREITAEIAEPVAVDHGVGHDDVARAPEQVVTCERREINRGVGE